MITVIPSITLPKDASNYGCSFALRQDNQQFVCEDISVFGAGQSFASVAPANWQKHEIYVVTNVVRSDPARTYIYYKSIILIKRRPSGAYLKWQYDLVESTPAIQCAASGAKWKMTVTKTWPQAKIKGNYILSLSGVKFERNHSGSDESPEVDDPNYSKKLNYVDGAAIRWKDRDNIRTAYFSRKL
jgi:hypothetical protein